MNMLVHKRFMDDSRLKLIIECNPDYDVNPHDGIYSRGRTISQVTNWIKKNRPLMSPHSTEILNKMDVKWT